MANSIQDALNRASAKDKQSIEAAKSHISSIENADKVTPNNAPSQTPANPKGLEDKQLDPTTRSNIENMQQSQGNNYLYQSPVDRAMARPTQQAQRSEPEQDKER